jgi:hypothetical protein
MTKLPPQAPILSDTCSIEEIITNGYHTSDQSAINSSRKDKFILVMDMPCLLKPYLLKESRLCHGGNIDRLKFSVWGTVIPDISINKIEVPFGGQTFKFSGNSRPSYPTINCNFTVDNRYDNYYILWKWLDIQNGAEDGLSAERIKQYATTITIFPLDEYEKPVAEFTYHDAFITNIGSISKSYRDASETESTFSFDFSQLTMKLV